jgi:decaprenylphospho-beta-D-ribofuranose 2-oxidase
MSATELSGSRPAVATERSLSGWGRTYASRAQVTRAFEVEDVLSALSGSAARGGGVIARGAGRSYGDAAQNAGGEVLDMTAMSRVLEIDRERRLITAEGGATVAALMAALAPQGLTLPVAPGTRHVTLAGAIASDIHGKNHHCDGGLARHVVELRLCTPAGGCVAISPDVDPELFYATLGGMGLTGVVVEATLRAEPLARLVAVDSERTESLEQTLALLAGEEPRRYSVGWLDLLARGPKFGRAIVSRADPLAEGEETGRRRSGRDPRPTTEAYIGALLRKPAAVVPRRAAALLRPQTVGAFNALRWRAAPRSERARPRPIVPYLFPLDALGEWNRLYGEAGLIQHQFVVPAGQEDSLGRCFELIRARRLPVYLAVFKRFGPSFGGPLSFPLEGWTLAADMPAVAPGLAPALDELDELVAGCGGRVYLTKDARLRRESLRAMYPQLERFQAQRARVDPEGVLRSDLGRRLGLCGDAR